MSTTLLVIPAALGSQVVLGLITSLIAGSVVSGAINSESKMKEEKSYDNLNAFSYDNLVAGELNKRIRGENAPQMICTQYKTAFKDEEILIKTLSEHGVENIQTEKDKIYCKMEALKFEFEKNDEGVYVMTINHNDEKELGIVNELGEEYQLNVQEESYNNLKKKLEAQNLEIDSEEVLDDNSIMITVNLD